MDYVLSPETVFAARRHLLHFVPAELANLILDAAEYWPMVSTTFAPPTPLSVAAQPRNAYLVARCCVLTPRIPGAAGVAVRVKRVRFAIRSRDQGWGGDPSPYPYANSYTWFEAAILRAYRAADDGDDADEGVAGAEAEAEAEGTPPTSTDELRAVLEERAALPCTPRDGVLSRRKAFPAVAPPLLGALFGALLGTARGTPARTMALVTVANARAAAGDVWEVQRNRRADAVERTHEVTWSAGGGADGDEEEVRLRTAGSGLGTGFVEAIRPGDRIAVIARAQYPGWQNNVSSISVDVYLSV